MLEVSALGWTLTIGVIVALLALDLILGVFRPHAVGFKEATAWSIFYIAVAIAFGIVFASVSGWDFGTQYFAGYIVEKSLSVDNLFVFVIIMSTFAVPEKYQQEVLTFGIIIALVLRVIFIALGATLLNAFSFMFLIFGLLLIGTAIQLFRHRDEDPSVDDNALVKASRRFLPVTDDYVGGKLIARIGGRRMVTPLFIVLIAIGSSDLLFALDSIPAVFGVTDEAFIVFAANAFALLGLRALFFLVKGLLDRLVYLSTGLSVILAFIGVKLVLHWLHVDINPSVPEISTPVSLIVIVGVLIITTVASLMKVRKDPTAVAHAGSVRGKPREDTRSPPETRPAPATAPGRFFSVLHSSAHRGGSAAVAADAGGAALPLVLLLVEDLADLPRLLEGVAAEHVVELGPLGRRLERRQLGAQPAAGGPLDVAVGQLGADLADLRRNLHDIPCSLTRSDCESVVASWLQRSAPRASDPNRPGKTPVRIVIGTTRIM